MSSKAPSTGILKQISSKLLNFFSRPDTPRQLQERKDLYQALLASTYKSLRFSKVKNNNTTTTSPTNWTLSRDQKQLLIDEASQSLQDQLIPLMTILELRTCMQNLLVPEIQTLFQAFSNVEEQLLLQTDHHHHPPAPSYHQTSTSILNNKRPKDESIMKPLLLQEFERLSEDIMMMNHLARDGNVPSLFITKLGAVKTILDYKGWLDPSSSHTPSSFMDMDMDMDANTNTSIDDFGYYSMEDHNPEIQQIMRTNQLYNLTNAQLLKQQLGYTTLALRSTLPNAGRGIYVEGHAPAGSIISFFPGDVWPREYLQKMSIMASHFEHDDSFQLSLRHDDILIDSRKSPAVVLDTDGSNPWALAHLANHPPKPPLNPTTPTTSTTPTPTPLISIPNCRPLAINYTSEMNLSKPLKKFVPNRYARKPALLGYNEAFERQDVFMHGLVLVTTRDVINEELFYDYRFSPPTSLGSVNVDGNLDKGGGGSGEDGKEESDGVVMQQYPDWYHICDEEGIKNRWK